MSGGRGPVEHREDDKLKSMDFVQQGLRIPGFLSIPKRMVL